MQTNAIYLQQCLTNSVRCWLACGNILIMQILITKNVYLIQGNGAKANHCIYHLLSCPSYWGNEVHKHTPSSLPFFFSLGDTVAPKISRATQLGISLLRELIGTASGWQSICIIQFHWYKPICLRAATKISLTWLLAGHLFFSGHFGVFSFQVYYPPVVEGTLAGGGW